MSRNIEKEFAVIAAFDTDPRSSLTNGLLWFVQILLTDTVKTEQREECAEKLRVDDGVRELLQTHSRETDLAKQVSEENHSVHLLCRVTFTLNYNDSFPFDVIYFNRSSEISVIYNFAQFVTFVVKQLPFSLLLVSGSDK